MRDGSSVVGSSPALNSCQGVIRCRGLSDLTEHEIGAELKDQGVVGVRRVTVKKDGAVIPTNTLFLTCNKPEMPKLIIRFGYFQVKVDLFVPNPLRCFGYNQFGRTSDRCKVDQNYALTVRVLTSSSSAKDCPVWQKEKDSARTRQLRNASFPGSQTVGRKKRSGLLCYTCKYSLEQFERSQ